MKLSEIMRRAKFTRGTTNVIFNVNFTNIENESDITEINNYAISFTTKMPKNSMLLLLDLRGLIANAKIEEKLTQMAIDGSKYFKASAILVDERTEESMKRIAKKLGVSKMKLYYDEKIAHEYLLNVK